MSVRRCIRFKFIAVAVTATLLVGSPPALSDPPQKPCSDGHVQCLIQKYWGGNDAEALKVAKCESNYDPHAQNGSHYGIFQLSKGDHEGRATSMKGEDDEYYTWDDMWDAGKNTRVAYSLYLDRGWGPWVCPA